MSYDPGILLLGQEGVLTRIKYFAGGLYLVVVLYYIILIFIASIQSGELALPQPNQGWLLLSVGGTVIISIWLGYSGDGLLVTGAVGLAFPAAFATVGIVLTLIGINDPDAPLWFYVLLPPAVGLLLAGSGFAIGRVIQYSIGT